MRRGTKGIGHERPVLVQNGLAHCRVLHTSNTFGQGQRREGLVGLAASQRVHRRGQSGDHADGSNSCLSQNVGAGSSPVANCAQELAPAGIRVNSVSPGPVFFEGGAWDNIKAAMPEIYESTVAMIPAGRMGSPEEICVQVALLLSPLSAYTTGTNVVVDGGFTKRIQF